MLKRHSENCNGGEIKTNHETQRRIAPRNKMEMFKPLKPMSFDGNISENWKRWKQLFELYMKASGGSEKGDEVKVALSLHVLSEEAIEKFNTFTLNDARKKVYITVLVAWEAYCVPKSNESVERHIFFSCNQREGEIFDSFLTDLKKLSASCDSQRLVDKIELSVVS